MREEKVRRSIYIKSKEGERREKRKNREVKRRSKEHERRESKGEYI